MDSIREVTYPGFLDVHVHFRDPGAPEAETRFTGATAARRGGFAAVVTMPNTDPAGDNAAWVREQLEDASLPVRILPSACITAGRRGAAVADLEELAAAGAAFFTDDGSYVVDDRVMEAAMRRAAALRMTVAQHALDPRLVAGGVIRDCPLARRLGLRVLSAAAETAAIERDLRLCRVTGAHLHVQHLSTAAGVELVRSAQREGLPVTAEATPHHLLFACDDLTVDDANFKMAPPLGNREDRAELRRAVKEGVLMFATDHAPHAAAKKAGGFAAAANGILGLETAVGVTYRVMVEEDGMSEADWARAWYEKPRAVIAARHQAALAALPPTRLRLGERYRVEVAGFASRAKNAPYEGLELDCRALVAEH